MEALFLSLAVAMVLLLAGTLIFSAFGLTSSARKMGETRALQIVLILVTVGATFLPAAIRISTGIDVDDDRLMSQIENTAGVFLWAKRLITVSTLLMSIGGCFWVLRNFFSSNTKNLNLHYAYVIFFTSAFAIAPLFSTVPALVIPLFYPLPVVLLLLLSNKADTSALVATARTLLGAVLVVSVLLALYPKWGFAMTHYGMIPGIPGRLAGATSHPNSMAPLGLIYIVLAVSSPIRSRWLHRLLIGVAVAVIGLVQSKTVLGASVLGLIIVVLYHFNSATRLTNTRQSNWATAGLAFILFASALGVFLFLLASLDALPFKFLGHKSLSELSTFVGRTDIWNITLSVWEKNIWFGYGPTIWSPEFRLQYLMIYVGQAHNQFIQTLGESGLVGVVGLTVYLVAIASAAIRAVSASNGLSLVVVTFFLTRCMTETPLRSMGVSDPTFLLHVVVLVLLLHWLKAPSSVSATERAVP